MRRPVRLLAVVLAVVSAAACSSGFFDIGAIEFHLAGPGESTHPSEREATPFTANGQPVDDGIVCDAGTVTIDHLEATDGETITAEDWASMFDTAMGDEGIVQVYSSQDFECEDGSGSFSMKVHHRFDFATFEFSGEHDVGFWEIEEGTGAYPDLSGSGDITIDWASEDVKYDGEVN